MKPGLITGISNRENVGRRFRIAPRRLPVAAFLRLPAMLIASLCPVLLSPVVATAAPVEAGQIAVLSHFDSGVLPPFGIEGNVIRFDLTDAARYHVDCLIRSKTPELKVRFFVNERVMTYLEHQGVYVSGDGETYETLPLERTADDMLETSITLINGDLFVATNYPYGRLNLERLIIDTAGKENGGSWSLPTRLRRPLAIFELGEDDGTRPVHYIIAEDARETGSQWVADHMIRILSTDRALAERLRSKSVLRICPDASPYTLTTGSSSYTDLDGRARYGGGSWIRDPLPPEHGILFDMMARSIEEKRLGMVLTLHSYRGASADSDLQTIVSADGVSLSEERVKQAEKMMVAFMRDVPHGVISIRQEAWNKGLLRHMMVKRFEVATFRCEVTTRGDAVEKGFEGTARAMLTNLAELDDWGFVQP